MSKGTTYKDSGVDIDAGNESIKRVKKNIHSTFNSSVLTGIGTFGAMYDLSDIIKTYKKPVLVQSIDSVGTKLVVANMASFHKTIGIDMVAHSCNDILCQGARPITFLDYIAVDKLDPNHIQDVVDGICEGCREADLPLTGGELAELPGVYKEGEYDLVGAVSGVVEKDKIIDGSKIAPGDAVLGLASSGLHTNGFSLARNVLFNIKKLNVGQYMEELECTLGEALLKPHMNYTRPVLSLLDEFDIKGIAHITGGGLVNNIPRVLPENCQIMISKDSWKIPVIFQLIQRFGNVPEDDMFKTFNMGIGLVLVVSQNEANAIANKLNSQGFPVATIGKVKEGKNEVVISESL
tara:strand:+ start:1043 stop:2092 length:1050 start_codon:yes stop_codon:yes gene_type:complete